MKILHLQPELNKTCGISKTVASIIKKNCSGDIFFVATFGGDGLERFYEIGIHPIILNYNRKNFFNLPMIFLKIYYICKKYKIDIIHSHHRFFDLISFLLSGIIRLKTITSVQSKVKGLKKFSYHADLLIAASFSIKNHLIEYFGVDEDKIVVINNFVAKEDSIIEENEKHLRRRYSVPSENIVLTFVGRFDREKGIDILLKAFLALQGRYTNVLLLLAGDGKENKFIEHFVDKNKLKVKIISPTLNIFEIYKLSNIIVLPSRVDPFPLVMLEAGLMKKPFIGSRVDGISEFINEGTDGLLFESGNTAELISVISKLISNREFADRLGKNLYEKVISNYTSDKIARQYQDVYEKLICNGK